MQSECVKFGWLIQNGTFYLEDPIEDPNSQPHYTCENLDPDTDVWTCFESWWHDNPWLTKKAKRSRPIPGHFPLGLAAAMFSGLDHDLCER